MPTPAPIRAIASTTISLGLVNIPCVIYSATEESAIRRSQFVKGTDHPVGMKSYDKVTGDDVTKDNIDKRIQVDDQTWVEVTDEEIAAVAGDASGVCSIIGFLPVAHLSDGTYYPENPYQIRPAPVQVGKVKRPNPAAEKAFSLVLEAMRRRGLFALVNYTSRSRPRYAALTSDGNLVTLRYDEEVRSPRPLPMNDLSEAEIAMGEMLIGQSILNEPLVLIDTIDNAVRSFAAEKAAAIKDGTEFSAPVSSTEVEAPNDLLAALTASVAASAR